MEPESIKKKQKTRVKDRKRMVKESRIIADSLLLTDECVQPPDEWGSALVHLCKTKTHCYCNYIKSTSLKYDLDLKTKMKANSIALEN